jgi:hypothetical protein
MAECSSGGERLIGNLLAAWIALHQLFSKVEIEQDEF